MAVILFLSQGVPMLVAGDEFGQTQQGNNNAWCQDNEISWLDWNLAEEKNKQVRFFRKLIHLRRKHPIFRRVDFFKPGRPDTPPVGQTILWQGLKPGTEDWSEHAHTLAFLLKGCALSNTETANFFIMLNGHPAQEALFTVPAGTAGTVRCRWKKIIDTAQEAPKDICDPEKGRTVAVGSKVKVAAMGCVVLQTAAICRPGRRRRKKRR
ncbi:MAG: hypothetical protein D3904_15675 [Candidatus Electrothrix sp. EH2]|nr:hypothetical protein [Candidatus Electrothrix sp. EH2]